MKNSVYCLGEVVYDIVFKNNQPVAANAGGSMLNAAVSLGRAQMPVSFIGECGADRAGELIVEFLKKNSVNTNYLNIQANLQTTISLAFLDEKNDASYSFYKTQALSYDRILPVFGNGDILLFGSHYSISDEHGTGILKTIRNATEKGTILYYDPNFRKPHLNRIKELRPLIKRNIRISDIIRGSHEDFNLIFGTTSARETWDLDCFRGNKALIYTQGGKEVQVFAEDSRKKFSVPDIKPLSTIGAGDSFNAGIIKALIDRGNSKTFSKQPDCWEEIIQNGIKFATVVCQSYENYIPEGFDG